MNQNNRDQATPGMIIGTLHTLQCYLHDQGMPTMAMSITEIINYIKEKEWGEDTI